MVRRLYTFLLGWPIFRGELLVSGSVSIWFWGFGGGSRILLSVDFFSRSVNEGWGRCPRSVIQRMFFLFYLSSTFWNLPKLTNVINIQRNNLGLSHICSTEFLGLSHLFQGQNGFLKSQHKICPKPGICQSGKGIGSMTNSNIDDGNWP